MTRKLETLAERLADAWTSGGTIPLPEAPDAATDRAEAYFAQDIMAGHIGGAVAGWKVGAPLPAVQFFEGHDGPIPGRVFADCCFDTDGEVDGARVHSAKVECEFAFRLTARLPDPGRPLIRADIEDRLTFHPAVELAATRYAPGTGNRATTTFDGIADNGTGAAAVLGPSVPDWQSLDLSTMTIDGRIGDSPPIQAYSGIYRKDPAEIMADILNRLITRGVTFEPGQCMLTGSATLPTPIRRGQTMTARFADFAPLTLTLS